MEEELQIIHEVYNDTVKRKWGFVPITMDDLLFAAGGMRAIADPEMILIAERDGQNAGVGLALPSINELLALIKNTPRWLRRLLSPLAHEDARASAPPVRSSTASRRDFATGDCVAGC